jgi:tripartite motif-containing protein 71
LEKGTKGTENGQLIAPCGVAVDSSGNVFVSDIINDRIQKFTNNGTFIRKWGTVGSGNGQLDNPRGLDSSGNVYVADVSNHRIQEFTNPSKFIRKWGSQGSGNGQFQGPTDVAVDGSGNVFVSDAFNFRIQKFTDSGKFIREWGAPLTQQRLNPFALK